MNRRRVPALGLLAGLLAAGTGLAFGQIVASLIGSRYSPVVAVGSEFIDLVPPWLKDLAIDLFGVHDKTALRVGIVLVLVALAAVAGVLAIRRPWAGLLIAAGLAVVGMIAAARRPDSTPVDVLPSLAAGVAAGVALRLFTRPFAAAADGPDGTDGTDGTVRGDSRRRFLRAVGVTAAVAVAAGGLTRLLGGRRREVQAARRTISVPAPPATTAPAGVQADGATPWVTPNPDFYRIDTALSVPLVVPAEWRLRIHGMVDRELTLTYDDLRRREVVHRWVTLCCVSNEVGGDLIGNAMWTGVRISDLLAEAGVAADADAVRSKSDDGWTCGTPLKALTDDRESLLAFGMNGEPLPLEHGFPVRMVVPGLYGFVSATKWVVELEVSRFDRFDAYWTPRGWSEQGPIKLASRIDVPRSKATAGKVTVAGVAWQQHSGVSKVEVRVDGGPWQRATLAADGSIDTWRQWHWSWDAPRGNHVLQVRAFDAAGQPQTEDEAPPAPDGATGLHTVQISVD